MSTCVARETRDLGEQSSTCRASCSLYGSGYEASGTAHAPVVARQTAFRQTLSLRVRPPFERFMTNDVRHASPQQRPAWSRR
jgi:hypothetical protein